MRLGPVGQDHPVGGAAQSAEPSLLDVVGARRTQPGLLHPSAGTDPDEDVPDARAEGCAVGGGLRIDRRDGPQLLPERGAALDRDALPRELDGLEELRGGGTFPHDQVDLGLVHGRQGAHAETGDGGQCLRGERRVEQVLAAFRAEGHRGVRHLVLGGEADLQRTAVPAEALEAPRGPDIRLPARQLLDVGQAVVHDEGRDYLLGGLHAAATPGPKRSVTTPRIAVKISWR